MLEGVFGYIEKRNIGVVSKMLPEHNVVDVVRFALESFDDAEVVVEKVEELRIFRGVEVDRARWTPYFVKQFVGKSCAGIGEPIPTAGSRCLFIAVALDPLVCSFCNGIIEDQNVYLSLVSLVKDSSLWDFVLGYVKKPTAFPT